MSTFMKIMLVPALVVAFSVGVALAASGVGGGEDSSSPLAQVAPSTDDSTTLETTTGADTTTGVTTTTEDPAGLEPGEDISGPCDEAENVNDPRCTGAGEDRDDNSGPGSGHDDGLDDNSGRGNGHDDDNSGPGNGDDDSNGHDDEGDDD